MPLRGSILPVRRRFPPLRERIFTPSGTRPDHARTDDGCYAYAKGA